MKKYFAALLLTVLSIGGTFAQKGASKDKNNEKLDQMIAELKLDDSQAEKVRAILSEHQNIMMTQKEIIKNSEKNIKAAKMTVKDSKEKTESELKAVLTEDQIMKYKELKASQKEDDE